MPKLYLSPWAQVWGCNRCCFLAEQQWCNLWSRVNLIVRILTVKYPSPLLEVANWERQHGAYLWHPSFLSLLFLVCLCCWSILCYFFSLNFPPVNIMLWLWYMLRWDIFLCVKREIQGIFSLSSLNWPTFQDNDVNQFHLSEGKYCRHPFGLFPVSSVIIKGR